MPYIRAGINARTFGLESMPHIRAGISAPHSGWNQCPTFGLESVPHIRAGINAPTFGLESMPHVRAGIYAPHSVRADSCDTGWQIPRFGLQYKYLRAEEPFARGLRFNMPCMG